MVFSLPHKHAVKNQEKDHAIRTAGDRSDEFRRERRCFAKLFSYIEALVSLDCEIVAGGEADLIREMQSP